jgi:hypothetical protein
VRTTRVPMMLIDRSPTPGPTCQRYWSTFFA